MDTRQVLGYLSGLVFAVSASLYVRDVALKKVKPNSASFAIWSVINISVLVSLILKHTWNLIPFAAVSVAGPVLVVIFSLKRKNYYFGLADKLSMVGVLLGFIFWLVTRDPAWNVYILSALSFITFMPLVIKTFQNPSLETVLPWGLNFAASILLLLTVPSLEIVQWIVPVRQFVCSLLLNLGLWRGVYLQRSKRKD